MDNLYADWIDEKKKKNKYLNIILTIVLVITIFLIIVLNQKDNYEISIKDQEIKVGIGMHYHLESNSKNLKYKMLDLNIANVNVNGDITGISEGSTNLIITSKDNKDYKVVKVLVKNSEEVKESVKEIKQEVKESVKEVKVDVKEPVKEVKEPVKEVKQEVKEPVKEVKEEVKEPVKEVKQEVKEPVKEVKEEVKEPVKEVKQEVKEPVKEIKQEIKEPVKEVKEEVKEPVKEKKINKIYWLSGIEKNVAGGGASRVYTLPNGKLIGGSEKNGKIYTVISSDNGDTWSISKVAASINGKDLANINFFYDSGILYMAYRATSGCNNSSSKCYTSLNVSVSHDEGNSWQYHSKIIEHTMSNKKENRGYWEPYLGLIDNKLTVFYSNDSIANNWQNIESLTWNGTKWTNKRIISNGKEHNSRDGMPSWIKLANGMYALVIESTKYRYDNHPFVIQILYSQNGINWSKPKDVYIPKGKGSRAAAPGIAELPNGQLVVSFQTDEDSSKKGNDYEICKTIYSDGVSIEHLTKNNFSKSEIVFQTTDGLWPSIHYGNNWLYVAGGSKYKKIQIN